MVPRLRFSGFNDRWVKRFLSDISIITTGSTPPTSEKKFYDSNDYMFISPFDIKDTNRFINVSKNYVSELGFQEGRKLVPNTVLFVGIGSTIGKVGQIKHESITNQQIHSLIADENTSNDFIYSLLECKKNRIRLLASNQAVPQINKSDFSKLKFYFPSHKEQQKIASFISSLDNKISQLEKKKTLLETYKRGIMQKIFSQELRFKDGNGQEFPDWDEKKLGEIANFFSGGTPNSSNQSFYKGDIPFIGSGDIKKKTVNKFITSEALDSSSAKIIEKGDLLYALYGATSGQVSLSKLRGAINQAVLCIRTDQSKMFLLSVLEYNKERILDKYLQGGQGNLSAKIVKSFIYSFPCLEEQKKIASFLSSIDNKIQITSSQLEKTREFKKGLLQQMFV